MPRAVQNPMKPNSRRYRTANVRGTVIELPAEGCALPVPTVPKGREWSAEEKRLWRDLWKSPQATQWDESYMASVAAYVCHASAVYSGTAAAWQAQEMRHLGNALGLTPSGMLSLGWVIAYGDQ